jgi:hypothetical protein
MTGSLTGLNPKRKELWKGNGQFNYASTTKSLNTISHTLPCVEIKWNFQFAISTPKLLNFHKFIGRFRKSNFKLKYLNMNSFKTKISIFTLFIVLLFSPIVSAQISIAEKAFAEAEKKGFSGVLLLAIDGKVVFEEATGYRSFEQKIPLQITDIFEMASVSKQFTAMMVMKCAEQGLLTYDDEITDYLDIPYPDITIRQLLTHTNGLPDYQAVMDKHWDKSKSSRQCSYFGIFAQIPTSHVGPTRRKI